MQVSMIEMPASEARIMRSRYWRACRERRSDEDRLMAKMFGQLARGRQIIDVREAIHAGGFDNKDRPKLAIARADWTRLSFRAYEFVFCKQGNQTGIKIQKPPKYTGWGVWQAIVPSIPPHLRPAGDLSKYHLLFEADWHAAPGDPLLLERIHGTLYAVLAQWDLTEVERAVLNITRGVNG